MEAFNTFLPSKLYAKPILSLLATVTIFKAMLDSDSVVLRDKEQVTEGGSYLAKWLATVAALVDKSIPALVALYDAILHGKEGR